MSDCKLTRRRLLQGAGASLGLYPALAQAATRNGGGPLAPRLSHFPARASRLVFVFLTGGMSHVDTFDPKPRLGTDAGKKLEGGFLLPTPFPFRRWGKSGLEISTLFPSLGEIADELCVIRSLHTDITEHFQATLAMHTGSATIPLPSLGAWISYGLGTANSRLPSYLVLASQTPYAGAQVWDCGFLPAYHQGVRIIPGDDPIPNLKSPARSVTLAEMERVMLRDVNEAHSYLRAEDTRLPARIQSFQTAAGMMMEAPRVLDLSQEPDAVLGRYGVQRGDNRSFAWQCLVARRLLESGVRVVELIDSGSSDNWDSHGDMQTSVPKARAVDQPLAALIRDLRLRGLLDDTLVVICTEFGRTPTTSSPAAKGREHHGKAFSCVLAGAGVQPGISYGATDEYGIELAEHPVHVHDFHATILHLMGLDHTRLTYRYAGRDFRLTDVDGQVVQAVLS